MKGIFKRTSAGLTGKAGEMAREQHKKKASTRNKRYIVRGYGSLGPSIPTQEQAERR